MMLSPKKSSAAVLFGRRPVLFLIAALLLSGTTVLVCTPKNGAAGSNGGSGTSGNGGSGERTARERPLPTQPLTAGWKRNGLIDDVRYDVYTPKSPRGALLVLPGWNFPKEDWPSKTKIVEIAEREGITLVMPDMMRTLYESVYYPETRMKWNKTPGGAFIRDRFLPEMQKRHGLFFQGDANFLLGLSTGGRGVALVALENPGLFRAGASISGDFCQELIPGERLMTEVYGSYQYFPERWTGRDNPRRRAAEWKMPLYMAHGLADPIVPEEQSRLFYEALKKSAPSVPVVYHRVPGAGHDYRLWGGELESAFRFFWSPAADSK